MWFSIATLNYQRAIAFPLQGNSHWLFLGGHAETYLHERNRMMYPISSDGSACFTNHTDISHKSVAPWPPKHSPVLVCGIARPTIPVLLSPPVTCSAIEACPRSPDLAEFSSCRFSSWWWMLVVPWKPRNVRDFLTWIASKWPAARENWWTIAFWSVPKWQFQ